MQGWAMLLYSTHGLFHRVRRCKLTQTITFRQPSANSWGFANDFSTFLVWILCDRKRPLLLRRMCSSHFAHDLCSFLVCCLQHCKRILSEPTSCTCRTMILADVCPAKHSCKYSTKSQLYSIAHLIHHMYTYICDRYTKEKKMHKRRESVAFLGYVFVSVRKRT